MKLPQRVTFETIKMTKENLNYLCSGRNYSENFDSNLISTLRPIIPNKIVGF